MSNKYKNTCCASRTNHRKTIVTMENIYVGNVYDVPTA